MRFSGFLFLASMYFQPPFPYYKFTRQETLHSSTTKLLLQYFITIWLSPMGNEQMTMRKLKNIFSERKGRSSLIRAYIKAMIPQKRAKFRWVSSILSCRCLTWGKSRWKGFHLSGQEEKECSFTALLQLKRREDDSDDHCLAE